MRTPSPEANAYGIDIGKNVFHVIGTDGGRPVQRIKLRRDYRSCTVPSVKDNFRC
jgi:hypothetical protein